MVFADMDTKDSKNVYFSFYRCYKDTLYSFFLNICYESLFSILRVDLSG